MADYHLPGFALITGAASGIGRETAYTFAESGAAGVVFADINEAEAKAAAEDSKKYATNKNYKAIGIKVDVTDPEDVQKLVDTAAKELGRIDYCVNAAGICIFPDIPEHTAEVTLENFNKTVDTNLKGTAFVTRAVCNVMMKQEPISYTFTKPRLESRTAKNLGRGSIVNLSSVYAKMADYGLLAYCTSKAGVLGVTKSAAVDHAKDFIRVNAVLPGSVNTPIMQRAIEKMPPMQTAIEKCVLLTHAMADPEEVAGPIAFLCSANASYITGSELVVDAGVMSQVANI